MCLAILLLIWVFNFIQVHQKSFPLYFLRLLQHYKPTCVDDRGREGLLHDYDARNLFDDDIENLLRKTVTVFFFYLDTFT